MKNCPECAEQIADDAVFCGECGTRVEERDNKKTMFGMGAIDADDLDGAVQQAKDEADQQGGGQRGKDDKGGQGEKKGGFRLPTPGEVGEKSKKGSGAPDEDVRNRPRTETSPKTLKAADEGATEEAFAKTEAMDALDEGDLGGDGDADLDQALADLEGGRLSGPGQDEGRQDLDAGPELKEETSPSDLGESPFSGGAKNQDRSGQSDQQDQRGESATQAGLGAATVESPSPVENSSDDQGSSADKSGFDTGLDVESHPDEVADESAESSFEASFGSGADSGGQEPEPADASFGAEAKDAAQTDTADTTGQQEGGDSFESSFGGGSDFGAGASDEAGASSQDGGSFESSFGGGSSEDGFEGSFGGAQQSDSADGAATAERSDSPLGDDSRFGGAQQGAPPAQIEESGPTSSGDEGGIDKKWLIIGGAIFVLGSMGCLAVAVLYFGGFIG